MESSRIFGRGHHWQFPLRPADGPEASLEDEALVEQELAAAVEKTKERLQKRAVKAEEKKAAAVQKTKERLQERAAKAEEKAAAVAAAAAKTEEKAAAKAAADAKAELK